MRVEKQSAFRMGWIMAMFDLPVMTVSERRAATKFRKELLDHGYLMIQFSVYARPCVTFEQLEGHVEQIKPLIPVAGNVRVMFMTDEQWKKSFTVIGPNYDQGNHSIDLTIPRQIEFWE